MAKVSYASLKLKVSTEVNTFKFNDSEIEVLKYLPVEDKCDIIDACLKKAESGGVYNPVILDMYLHLYMVYLYSNLTFTDKQKEDEGKLYNALCSSGFMDQFIAAMEDSEYDYLFDMLTEYKEDKMRYNSTAAAIVSKVITDLPVAAEAAAKIMDNFNPEQYQRIVSLAEAVGKR